MIGVMYVVELLLIAVFVASICLPFFAFYVLIKGLDSLHNEVLKEEEGQ